MRDKIAVVGGAGFIGSALIVRLCRGGRDVCLFDTQRRIERFLALHRDLANLQCRILDSRSGFHGFDNLVCLSGGSSPGAGQSDIESEVCSHVLPSLRIFEQAARDGVKKVVFASSGGTVYGDLVADLASEDSRTRPISTYGVSKLALEGYLSVASRVADLTGISLRISNPYGPYQYSGSTVGAIAKFIKRIKERSAIEIWGDGEIVRDYIYIEDVIDALVKVLDDEGRKSGVYNIGSGVGTSLNTLIRVISQKLAASPEVRYSTARAFDVARIVLDVSAAKHRFGWSPSTSLEDGIQKMINAYPAS